MTAYYVDKSARDLGSYEFFQHSRTREWRWTWREVAKGVEYTDDGPWFGSLAEAMRDAANQGAIVNSIIERTRHEPTDDEREAQANRYIAGHGDSQTRRDFLAGWDAAIRRTDVPEPSALTDDEREAEELLPGPSDTARAHLGEWRERRHTPTDDDREALIEDAIRIATKGVQVNDGHQYMVPAHDLVEFSETIMALVELLRRSEVPEPSAEVALKKIRAAIDSEDGWVEFGHRVEAILHEYDWATDPGDESVPCPECGEPRPFGLDFMCLDCNGVRYVSENDWYAHHGCGFEEQWKYQREAREAIAKHLTTCEWPPEPQLWRCPSCPLILVGPQIDGAREHTLEHESENP